jgi:hypothetical protein
MANIETKFELLNAVQPMTRHAIIRPSVYYGFVFLLTVVVHLQSGWSHSALFPKSLTILLVAGMVALPWFLLNLLSLFSSRHREKSMGELCIHLLFFILVSFVIVPNL